MAQRHSLKDTHALVLSYLEAKGFSEEGLKDVERLLETARIAAPPTKDWFEQSR